MALNKVIIMGRITHDLELKQTPNGTAALSFTVAVDRYSKNSEEKQADFISCVAWRQTAEFISKYFGKGRMIAVTGNLHSRTYDDKNGSKHYVTEVYVDSADFTGEPKGSSPEQAAPQENNGYPSPHMYAPKADKPAETAAEYAAFEIFGGADDTVPF